MEVVLRFDDDLDDGDDEKVVVVIEHVLAEMMVVENVNEEVTVVVEYDDEMKWKANVDDAVAVHGDDEWANETVIERNGDEKENDDYDCEK